MSKRTLMGMALALLLIIAGTSAFLSFRSTFTRPEQPKAVRPPSYWVQRSPEVPLASHRALSMVASQRATALLPWGIAVDSLHGFTWVAEPGCEPKPKCPSTLPGILGQYALADGTFITNFSEPGGYSSPLFVVVDGNGEVWFTQPSSDAIGEFDPHNESWQQWHLRKGSSPFDLVLDRNGNLWFTEFGASAIGFFNPRTHTLLEHPTPTPASNPYGITVDPQGTAWFTENAVGVDQIASFAPTLSGAIHIREHAVGGLRPHLIATDRAGNLWYSGGFDGDIGEFHPRSGSSTRFVVYRGTCSSPRACSGTHISGIAVDSKGQVWFTDSLSQRVGYLLAATGQVVTRTLAGSNAHPYDGLLLDGSDRVWFTQEFGLMLTIWPASLVK